MFALSHKIFAAGIAAIFSFWWDLGIIPLILLIPLASFMGLLPDYDIKLNIPHRTSTHNVIFILIMSILVTAFAFIILGFLQLYIPIIDNYIRLDLMEGYRFPIPSYGDAWYKSSIIGIFLAIFFASLSHLLLDIDTKAGLNVSDIKVQGVFVSSGWGNEFFSIVGYAMMLFGIGGVILVNTLHTFESWFFNVIITILIVISICISIVSIFIHQKISLSKIHCGRVNNINLCSKNTCININGEKFCLDDEK